MGSFLPLGVLDIAVNLYLWEKVKMMSFKLKMASIVGALFLATSANAATCTVNHVSFTLDGATGAQCMAGNDLSSRHGIEGQDLEVFELTGWVVGASTVAGIGDGIASFLSAPAVDATSGSWSLASFGGYGPLMIVLKSGHQWGAFLLEETIASLSGTWNVQRERCNANGCSTLDKALTHASVYHGVQPAAVPLPATGFALLGGLMGLAALRRKRKAA